MEIIKIILMYLLAIFIVACSDIIAFPLIILLRLLIRKIKPIQPVIFAVLDIISNFIAVFIIVLLCKKNYC